MRLRNCIIFLAGNWASRLDGECLFIAMASARRDLRLLQV